MDALGRRRLQIEDRRADIAADLRPRSPASRKRCAISAVVVDLAVGAGDGDDSGAGRAHGALAAEQFDVADDLDAGGLRALTTVQCGSGWVSGTPGDEDQAR